MESLKSIKTDADHRAALAEIDRLAEARPGTDEFDRLDILATLVEAYEARQFPIGPPSPLAAIEYEMEKRGLSRRDLEPILGPSGRVSEVLSGQRPLTLSMVRRLHQVFHLSADVLLASDTEEPARAKKLKNPVSRVS